MLGMKTWSSLLLNLSKCPARRPRRGEGEGEGRDGTFWGAPFTPPGTLTPDYLQVMHMVPRRATVPPPHPVGSERKPIDLFFKVEKLHLPPCVAAPGARPGAGREVWRITFRFCPEEVAVLYQPCCCPGASVIMAS